MLPSTPSSIVSVLLLLVTAAGCSASTREPRWSSSPSSARLSSAPMSRGYCSPGYQSQFGWPDPAKAANVCRCESRGNPHAVSRNGLYAGLFQFSRATWQSLGGGDAFDPNTNSEHAYRLFSRRGWRPWPVCGR